MYYTQPIMVTRFFKTIVIMDSKQETAYIHNSNVHRLFSQVRGMLALADQTFLKKLAVYTTLLHTAE